MQVDAGAASRGSAPPPGWYTDPWRLAPRRWWDGLTWTGFTAGLPAGRAGYGTGGPSPYPSPQPAAVLPQARGDIHGGGIAILGFFGAIAIALLFERALVSFGADPGSLPVLVGGQLGLWGGLSMAAFIVTHRRAGGSLADLGMRWPTGQEIGIGIGIGFGGLFLAARVALALRALFPDDTSATQSHLFLVSRPSFTVILVTGALACIGAPIFEEMFFRGIVQSVLTRNLGVPPAIVLQAILFGSAHFQLGMTFNQAIVRCGTVSVLGLFLGYLRNHTGRLGAGMVAHATNNLIVVIVTMIALAARPG